MTLVAASLEQSLNDIFASKPMAIADPFPVWSRLRETAQVYRLGELILFPRYKDAAAVLKDARFVTNTFGRGTQFEAVRARLSPVERQALDEVTAFEAMYVSRNNDETHARLRRIAQRAFTPQRVMKMRSRIETYASELIAPIKKSGGGDLMTVAYRLPLIVVGELLGVPPDALEKIRVWSSALARNRGGTETPALMAAHAAMLEFRAYTETIVEALRSRPPAGEDDVSVVSTLIDAEQAERLTTAELMAMFVVLLFAGHETTTNLIGGGVLALLREDSWRDLASDPSLLPNAIEELLRFVTPVQWTGRVAAEDIDWSGVSLTAGSATYPLLAAANRDPAVFADPDRLDIRRANARQHLAFGIGAHFCIGFQLARMEANVVFSALGAQFPDMKLVDDDLEWGGNSMLRSLQRLPVDLGRVRAGAQ